jgi:hypothetical protein
MATPRVKVRPASLISPLLRTSGWRREDEFQFSAKAQPRTHAPTTRILLENFISQIAARA